MKSLSWGKFIWLSLFAPLLALQPAFADDIDRGTSALRDGRAAEAYRLFAPLEADHAGDPGFDYALGLAALDSGHLTEAVFAFERVLAIQPGHAQARAELARAYFLMGENEAATGEFNAVIASNPPDEVRESIGRYLNALEHRFSARKGRLRGFIEFGAGHDTNVNSATSADQVAVPALGNLVVRLADESLSQEDAFATLSGGVTYTHPLRHDLELYAGVTADLRRNGDERRFDTEEGELSTGLRWLRGLNRYVVGVQAATLRLDGDRLREITGLNLQWQRVIDARNQATLFLQYAEHDYPGQEIRDIQQTTVGAAWVHAFDHTGGPVIYVGAYRGDDREQADNRPDLGRDFYGLRLGGEVSLSDNLLLNAGVIHQAGRYDEQDPIFRTTRRDDLTDISIGLDYDLGDGWSLRPRLRHTRNDSNIPINDYERTQGWVAVRKDF